jgi:parallel beta-helix repeat protein
MAARALVTAGAALTMLFVSSPLALADGSILYVDRSNPSCSNTGPGTATQPFCTIGAGASRAIAGQTVQVAPGTYSEVVNVSTSGTSTAPIVFTAAPGATVTLSGQANGFIISGKSWITVAGFAVTHTTSYGISVGDSSHITLASNHVSYSGQPVSGMTASGIRLTNVTDSLVSGNTSDHNSDHGIYLTNGSTRNEVRGNSTFNNAEGYQRAAAGIRLYSSPGNTVDANITHDNEDSGIECYTGSNNTLLYNNVTYKNGDHGIDNFQTTGQRVIANSVYKNVTAGINVEGSSTGATLANNISVDNGIASPRTHGNIRVEAGSTSGTTMDSDLVHLTTSDVMLIWNSTSYASLASFQAATGQEVHGIQADPRWRSPVAGDFHLTAGSAAIDSANSGVSGQPNSDVEGHLRVDDPATPNTGLGPRSYDDRGAYEYGSSGDSPPVSSLSVSPSSGFAPLAVTADASASTDTDATPIASYRFDFGDGSPVVGPQSGATATHAYTAAGTYTVTVTVRDTGGLSSTAQQQVIVTEDNPPAVALTVTPSSGPAPLDVAAEASGSDTDGTPIASYTFDFGDGSVVGPQPQSTASHRYTTAGTYTVTVTVRDEAGLQSQATRQVAVSSVLDQPPAAALTVPSSGRVGLEVTADASASTDTDATPIASYTFNFGDGSPVVGPQSGATATHVYTAAGTYTVTVTVTDTAGLSSTASKRIKIKAR